MNTIDSILFTLLGWLLGLLAIFIKQRMDNRQAADNFKKILGTEFKELTTRLIGTYYILTQSLGKLDKAGITWVCSMSKQYPGEIKEETLKYIEKLNDMSDQQIKALSMAMKEQDSISKFLKTYYLTILEANINTLNLLDPDVRCSVLIIKRNITWLNESIRKCDFYFEKTFDSGLSKENYLIVKDNLFKEYGRIADLCKKTADICSNTIKFLN